MNQILNSVRKQSATGFVKPTTILRALKHNKKHSMWVMIASQADLDAFEIVKSIASRLGLEA